MKFSDYQAAAAGYAVYDQGITKLDAGTRSRAMLAMFYATIGLCNEAGEVAGKVKKLLRDDIAYADAQAAIIAELGDTLWYLSEMATLIGVSFDEIAKNNLTKLRDRKEREKLHGDGDKR